MTGSRIVFDAVSLSLGGNAVLNDVSFKVEPGEVHAIVGPNGGGKTSLIRALLGQMPHTGSIRIDAAARPVIGYVPQALIFDRTLPLTVGDVVAIMCQKRPAFWGQSGPTKAQGKSALASMNIDHKWRAQFGRLSGGERQRVLVAQAILPHPDILILDEATSNMDDDGAQITEALVLKLSASGTTVLWINHDWDQVRRVANSATGLNRSVMFSGPAREVVPAMNKREVVG